MYSYFPMNPFSSEDVDFLLNMYHDDYDYFRDWLLARCCGMNFVVECGSRFPYKYVRNTLEIGTLVLTNVLQGQGFDDLVFFLWG